MTAGTVSPPLSAPSAPAPKVRPPLPRSTAFVLWVVSVISGLALWGVGYPILIGALQEQDSQQRLFDDFRSQLAQATAPVGPTAYGKPVALLDSPTVGLRGVVVVEGTGAGELETGPGHRRDTVLPGQAGTVVLLGKAITFGGPFGRLAELRPGDTITATTGQGVFTYVVDRIRRPGDPLPAALPTGSGRLVLGSAEGAGWRGGFAPTSVVYVDSTLKGPGQPSPRGRVSGVPSAEVPMGVSTAPLLGLVFWLEALLLAVVGVIWLRARWGRWQSWVVGFPVVLAISVAASGSAAQLLPNLL